MNHSRFDFGFLLRAVTLATCPSMTVWRISIAALFLALGGCHSGENYRVDAGKSSSGRVWSSSANQAEPDKGSVDQQADVLDEQWPLFRGGSQSQGVAGTELPESLDVLWQYEIKKGMFESTPIIITADKNLAIIGDADGLLLALNLENGEEVWRYKSENGYVTAAAYRDGNIFIGDMDGAFFCLDTSGNLKWKYQVDGAIDSSANFYGELVLFGARDTRLYALNRKTGQAAWQLETNDEIRCGITVVSHFGFVAGCDGSLHVIDLDHGTEVASVPIESPTGVTPAVRGEMVFAGTEQADFNAINWRSKQIKWKFNDPEGSISTRSSPAVNAKHVIFGTRNRQVYSLDPRDGSVNWQTELKGKIDSSPVISGQRVFVGSTDGRLTALDLNNGRVSWQRQFNGGFVGSPAVGLSRLVIATERGVVYCLGSEHQATKDKLRDLDQPHQSE
jgi:outer membrane protein assembly factor BamB